MHYNHNFHSRNQSNSQYNRLRNSRSNQVFNYSSREFFMEVRERQWWQKRHYYNMRRYAEMMNSQQNMERNHGRQM